MADQVPFFRVVDGWTAAPAAALPTAAFCNDPAVQAASIPAGGVMTARGIARVYAGLGSLVPPAQLAELTAQAVSGTDEVTGHPVTRALGYDLGFMPPLDAPTVFGMAGSGGTAAYSSKETGVTVAIAKNLVTAGDYSTYFRVWEVVEKALGE